MSHSIGMVVDCFSLVWLCVTECLTLPKAWEDNYELAILHLNLVVVQKIQWKTFWLLDEIYLFVEEWREEWFWQSPNWESSASSYFFGLTSLHPTPPPPPPHTHLSDGPRWISDI